MKETADRYFAQQNREENVQEGEGEKRSLFERLFGRRQNNNRQEPQIIRDNPPSAPKRENQAPQRRNPDQGRRQQGILEDY